MKKMRSLSYTKHLLEEGNTDSCSKIDELTSASDVQREMSHVPHMWKLKIKLKEIDLNVEQ